MDPRALAVVPPVDCSIMATTSSRCLAQVPNPGARWIVVAQILEAGFRGLVRLPKARMARQRQLKLC